MTERNSVMVWAPPYLTAAEQEAMARDPGFYASLHRIAERRKHRAENEERYRSPRLDKLRARKARGDLTIDDIDAGEPPLL